MKLAATIILGCTLGLTSAALAAGSAPATGDADSVIQYRQGVMSTIGANAGAIAAILQGKVPQQATLVEHARVLATATTWIPAAFAQNTDGQGKEKTKAKPDVWSNKDKFASNVKDLQAAAQKLSKLADAGDMAGVGDAVKPLFKACKSCHDDFKSK
jgi:cytochrome c556